MKERTSSTEKIYGVNGAVIDEVVIASSSMRVFKLMSEDYIRLDFFKEESTFYPIGAYIVDEIFGKFVLTKEQMPKYDNSSASYKYELKFDKWYKVWNNKIVSLVTESVSSGNMMRNETEWVLTNTLIEQMRQFMMNLQILGFVSDRYDFYNDDELNRFVKIDENVEKQSQALTISYSSVNMIDALKNLSDSFECEYWIEGSEQDFAINFGKCEKSGDPLEISLETNVGNMDISDGTSLVCDKLNVYGSTDNVPSTYRKTVSYQNVTKQSERFPIFRTDKAFSYEMFNSQESGDIVADVYANYEAQPEDRFERYDGHLSFGRSVTSETPNFLSAGVYYIRTDNPGYAQGGVLIAANGAIAPNYIDVGISVNLRLISEDGRYANGTLAYGNISQRLYKETDPETHEEYFQLPAMSLLAGSIALGKTINVVDSDNYFADLTISVNVDSDVYLVPANTWDIGIVDVTTFVNIDNIRGDEEEIYYSSFKVSIDGRELWATVNPYHDKKDSASYNTRKNLIGYYRVNPDGSKGEELTNDECLEYGLCDGIKNEKPKKDIYILDAYQGIIPSAYYVNDLDNPASLLSIGDTRLRLPIVDESVEDFQVSGGYYISEDGRFASKNGYIIPISLVGKENDPYVREASIVFDRVYPDGKLLITDVFMVDQKSVTEYEGESDRTVWDYHQFHVKVKTARGKEFPFSADFQLPGTLKMRFITPNDVKDIVSEEVYEEMKKGCKLAGMQFETNFKKSAKYVESGGESETSHSNDYMLIRNDDFGAKLPSDTLAPRVNDPVVLVGWNVRAMSSLGLIREAEFELLKKGFDYMSAMTEGNLTFTCTMRSDWMFSLISHITLVSYDNLLYKDSTGAQIMVKNGFDAYSIPVEGQKVTINHQALKGGRKTSRIIGYEFKLDKPYDSPKYTIGETEAYSRLAKIEKEITSISN